MKQWPTYIGASLLLHLLLYGWLINAPHTPSKPIGEVIHFHIDLIPEMHNDVAPVSKPVHIPEPQPRFAETLSTTYNIQIAPKSHLTKPSPQASIPYKKPAAFGLHTPAYLKKPTSDTTLSAKEVAKRNLKEFAQQLTKDMNDKPNTTAPGWGTLVGQTAKDGAAFYAAASAGNIPALIAVTTVSLHSGALGHTFQKVRQHLSATQTLTPAEANLLATMEHLPSTTARDLYLALPPGWTYRTLEKSLNKLVARGALSRQGKSHTATYTRK